ncbi:MAG: coenzyme F420-0:L-glutamate ligase [Candidatus Bathyarchaeia archaeon]
MVALAGFPLTNSSNNIAKIIVETTEKNGFKIGDGDEITVAQKVFLKSLEKSDKIKRRSSLKKSWINCKNNWKNPRLVELVLKEMKKKKPPFSYCHSSFTRIATAKKKI